MEQRREKKKTRKPSQKRGNMRGEKEKNRRPMGETSFSHVEEKKKHIWSRGIAKFDERGCKEGSVKAREYAKGPVKINSKKRRRQRGLKKDGGLKPAAIWSLQDRA